MPQQEVSIGARQAAGGSGVGVYPHILPPCRTGGEGQEGETNPPLPQHNQLRRHAMVCAQKRFQTVVQCLFLAQQCDTTAYVQSQTGKACWKHV